MDYDVQTPLSWPVTKPRYKGSRKSASFGAGRRGARIDESVQDLARELALFRARDVVITYNRRQDQQKEDPGAAVYFELPNLGKHVLAVDRWDRTGDNLRAIALHVQSLRGQDRWGVGSVAEAFAGYKALAAVGEKKPWFQVLGFTEPPSYPQAEQKYMELMRLHHPDRGGNSNQAAEITAAWADGRREMGA